MEENQTSVQTVGESRFTGGAFENFGINFVTNFVSGITLGIAYPFMKCWKLRWRCSHTFVDDKQMSFDGTGGQLFGNYIKWTLLSIITLGIYYILCARVAMEKWETKHTHFAGEEAAESEFNGTWYQYFGASFLAGFVSLITLGIGSFWAHCYMQRWLNKHKVISGRNLYFDGKAIQYFGVRIKWMLLTVITLGIYGFWLAVKSIGWTVSHTHLGVQE